MASSLTTRCSLHVVEDIDSFETLDTTTVFRNEFAFVWRNLGRFGVPPSDLDDAVQKVFLIVHRKSSDLAQFDPRDTARLKGWLFQIDRRGASDERRVNRARPAAAQPTT